MPRATEYREAQQRVLAAHYSRTCIDVHEVRIRGDMIRLGQLLKLAGVVESGGELKELLAASVVVVNGEPEARRGRQLHPGDSVRVGAQELVVVADS